MPAYKVPQMQQQKHWRKERLCMIRMHSAIIMEKDITAETTEKVMAADITEESAAADITTKQMKMEVLL